MGIDIDRTTGRADYYTAFGQTNSNTKQKQTVSKDVAPKEKRDNQVNGAILTISAGGMSKLQDPGLQAKEIEESVMAAEEQEKNYSDKEDADNSLFESMMEQLEASKEEKEGFKDIAKLLEIARRIARGDRVPPKDEKKLMEYNINLYQMAKSAATLHANMKHKKHKSMFDDEKKADMREKLDALKDSSASQTDASLEDEMTGEEQTDTQAESE